jgi:hypothetical protein
VGAIEERSTGTGGRKLWFGVSGAAVAWFAHLNIVYILVPVVCAAGGIVLMYIASLVLAVVALAAGLVSLTNWRKMSAEEQGNLIGEMEGSRVGFMYYAGLLAAGIFLLAIIMQTIPIFFLNPCTMQGRI